MGRKSKTGFGEWLTDSPEQAVGLMVLFVVAGLVGNWIIGLVA